MGKMTYEELEALCERLSKKLTAVRSERFVLKEKLALANAHDEIMARRFEERVLQEETVLADGEKKLVGYMLAPCPICGARADLVEDTDFKSHYIGCSNSKCGITLFATKHKTIKEQVDAWNLSEFSKPRNLEKTPVVRALRDRLGRYEEALKKINDEDIDCVRDAVRIAESALESLPTIRKVDDDPDDYYTEPTDGSHGMQGVPGR